MSHENSPRTAAEALACDLLFDLVTALSPDPRAIDRRQVEQVGLAIIAAARQPAVALASTPETARVA